MSDGAFVIEEVGGRGVSLRLNGRGLPNRPFTLTGMHEIAESRAMGSPYTTQQPTGAREEPTELTGEWNDIYLAGGAAGDAAITVVGSSNEVIDGLEVVSLSSTQIQSVREAAEVVDDLRRRGVLVRVSWAHIARLGRIKRFAQKWQTINDLEWEMTIIWVGADEDIAVAAPENVDPAADVRAIAALADAAIDATEFPIENIDPTLIGVVDRRIARVQSGVLAMSQAVRTRVEGATTEIDVFRRVLAMSSFVVGEAKLLALEIDARVGATWVSTVAPQVVPTIASRIPNPEDLSTVAPGHALAALITARIGARSARKLAEETARRRFDRVSTLDEVAAVYMAREGDDLQSIARFHFGSEDAWTILRDYNHLPSATLQPGDIVVAPLRQRAS